jgi:hypothetical protein
LELDPAPLQIKAIHARGGQPLTKAEVIELLERPMYLGMPKPIPPKARGRKPKNVRTQYDESYELRRGWIYRLKKLPNLRAGVRTFQHAQIERLFLDRFARGTAPRKVVLTVLADLQRDPKKPCPNERTLRRILAGMRSNFPK